MGKGSGQKPKATQAIKGAYKLAAETGVKSFEKWAIWDRKVSRLQKRDYGKIMRGWLAHIPEIASPGYAPQEGIEAISSIAAVFSLVKGDGDVVQKLSGARPAVLHEAFYLAHKAIHVEIVCANAIKEGRHTWAVVDAYQASLFALGSILAFLGITVERHENDFILVDVWGTDPNFKRAKGDIDVGDPEIYQFIRFKSLDHFHKWAILRRLLRTLDIKSALVQLVRDGLEPHDDKRFAYHRNQVHYQSAIWLSGDLLIDDVNGPIKQAQSPQDIFDDIYAGTPSGTVYLMAALIEIACMFAEQLSNSETAKAEIAQLNRRKRALKVISNFDWVALYPAAT